MASLHSLRDGPYDYDFWLELVNDRINACITDAQVGTWSMSASSIPHSADGTHRPRLPTPGSRPLALSAARMAYFPLPKPDLEIIPLSSTCSMWSGEIVGVGCCRRRVGCCQGILSSTISAASPTRSAADTNIHRRALRWRINTIYVRLKPPVVRSILLRSIHWISPTVPRLSTNTP